MELILLCLLLLLLLFLFLYLVSLSWLFQNFPIINFISIAMSSADTILIDIAINPF